MNLPNGPSTSNPAGHPEVRKEEQPESATQKTATGRPLDQAAKKQPPSSDHD
jgi:hypothetical protein